MGAQETALIISTISLPLAACYSIARWDASRYAVIPHCRSPSDQPKSDEKSQKIQGAIIFIGGLFFLAFCGFMGYSSKHLSPQIRDLAFIILLSVVPATLCLSLGALLTGTAYEVFARNERGVLENTLVKKRVPYRIIALSLLAAIPICNRIGAPQLPIMVLLGIGSMFLPSLLMGANPSVNSPSLRSLIRFEVVKGVVVLLMSVALPKIVDWLTSLDNKDPVPPAQLPIPPSTFAPWKDRTEAMYALFLPAMQTGGFVGILLSRLYRIDMANFRRQHPEADLRRDTLPGYLLVTESEAKSKLGAADDAEEGLEPHSVAIRVLSIPEAIRTNTIQQLLCPPWYFAAGYLTMLLLLVFALPTFVRYSPMVMVLREESFKLQGVAFDDSAWLTPNLSIAMYGAVHLLLLPLPMLLAVAVLSFLRGESDFVWNHQAEWKPFSIEDTVEAAEDTGADEKIVAGMLINDGYKEEETLI